VDCYPVEVRGEEIFVNVGGWAPSCWIRRCYHYFADGPYGFPFYDV